MTLIAFLRAVFGRWFRSRIPLTRADPGAAWWRIQRLEDGE